MYPIGVHQALYLQQQPRANRLQAPPASAAADVSHRM
jgi:hypothetical protein